MGDAVPSTEDASPVPSGQVQINPVGLTGAYFGGPASPSSSARRHNHAWHLTMFATRPRPSRRRYKNWGLSWGTRTLRIFASIAPSSGRQHDPQHEAGMWRSRVLDQLAVLDATNSQSCFFYEDEVSLLSSLLVSTRKAAHAQSSPAVPCRVFNPGSLGGAAGVDPYCRV